MTENRHDSAATSIENLHESLPCTPTPGNAGLDADQPRGIVMNDMLSFVCLLKEWLLGGLAAHVDDRNNGAVETLSQNDKGVLVFHSVNAGRQQRTFFAISRIAWKSEVTSPLIQTGIVISLNAKTRLAVAVLIQEANQHVFVCAPLANSQLLVRISIAEGESRCWVPVEGSHWQRVDVLPRGPVHLAVTHRCPSGISQSWTAGDPVDFTELGVALLLSNVNSVPMPPLPVDALPIVQSQDLSKCRNQSSVRSSRFDSRAVRYVSAIIVGLLVISFLATEYIPVQVSSDLPPLVLDARTSRDRSGAAPSTCDLPSADWTFSSAGDSNEDAAIRIELWHDSDGKEYVTAVLNDTCTAELRLDSDSPFLRLPRQVAEEAGAIYGPGEPCISVTLEDGRVLECERMQLDKVDFGRTSLKHVECAVLPRESKSLPSIGGMFLARYCSAHSFTEDGVLELVVTPDIASER